VTAVIWIVAILFVALVCFTSYLRRRRELKELSQDRKYFKRMDKNDL
jgi:hypothetical protein